MSVGEIYPSMAEFLKASDLGANTIKVKISYIRPVTFGDSTKLVLDFEGKDKALVLNKTNANIIKDVYGDDEQQWAGKEIMVYAGPVTFKGQSMQGLKVRVETAPVDVPF